MASFTYDRFFYHMARGEINALTDTFKALLVTSAYAPNKGTDDNLGSLTNEVAGTGYTAGGKATACTISLDAVNHRVDLAFAGVNWPASTITNAHAIIVYRVGTDAASSYLCAYAEFSSDKSDTAATFAVSFDTPIRIQN